jgi:hypothetical protein
VRFRKLSKRVVAAKRDLYMEKRCGGAGGSRTEGAQTWNYVENGWSVSISGPLEVGRE